MLSHCKRELKTPAMGDGLSFLAYLAYTYILAYPNTNQNSMYLDEQILYSLQRYECAEDKQLIMKCYLQNSCVFRTKVFFQFVAFLYKETV